jgi:alpha-D-ribose 1-methylphosphonate 5-triphosphate diphosphatase
VIHSANVIVGDDGRVLSIERTSGTSDDFLIPAAVDLHLDNLVARRRPRATVHLPLESVVPVLDVECAAAGIGAVLVSARFEDEPKKGITSSDAVALCELIEQLHPFLACDWFIHARVEVTDEGAIAALEEAVARSSRIRLISMMDHSAERSRFSSAEAHREFYAADLGITLDEMDAIMERKRAGGEKAARRREMVAAIALRSAIVLVSHDDRTPEQVDEAAALGATVAEFPLTIEAAARAREHGMSIVLGAPNAVRGRSTSPGNVLVADAVRAGLCDVLCSDYLPSALVQAAFRLAEDEVVELKDSMSLITAGAAVAGLDTPAIKVGELLNASLRRRSAGADIGIGLWRNGELVYQRSKGVVRPCRAGG